jgi:hypothetical protein
MTFQGTVSVEGLPAALACCVTGAQAERALFEACRRGHADVVEFTVAPRDPALIHPRVGLEWLIEFAEPPRAPDVFGRVLDVTLRGLNRDYGTGRAGDSGLLPPRIVELPVGTFQRWLQTRGDSRSVPHVASHRIIADGLLIVAAARGLRPLITITSDARL